MALQLRRPPRFTGSDSATTGRRWYRAAIVLFALALLSKAMVMTLPVMLLLLDVYPLRRLRFGRADRASTIKVLAEKIPFFALALGAAVVAVLAQRQLLSSIASVGLADRLALSLNALMFYIGKTLVPYGLAPLSERPRELNPLALPFVLSVSAVSVRDLADDRGTAPVAGAAECMARLRRDRGARHRARPCCVFRRS